LQQARVQPEPRRHRAHVGVVPVLDFFPHGVDVAVDAFQPPLDLAGGHFRVRHGSLVSFCATAIPNPI
jgi:hypothetical protein